MFTSFSLSVAHSGINAHKYKHMSCTHTHTNDELTECTKCCLCICEAVLDSHTHTHACLHASQTKHTNNVHSHRTGGVEYLRWGRASWVRCCYPLSFFYSFLIFRVSVFYCFVLGAFQADVTTERNGMGLQFIWSGVTNLIADAVCAVRDCDCDKYSYSFYSYWNGTGKCNEL